MKKLIYCLVALSLPVALWSQRLYALEEYISPPGSQNNTLKQDQKDAAMVASLATELQPCAYFNAGQMRMSGKGQAQCLDTDAGSMTMAAGKVSSFPQVQMLKLKLRSGDAGLKIDPALINGLGALKYVLITCEFNCTEAALKQMLPVTNKEVIWLYKIAVPS